MTDEKKGVRFSKYETDEKSENEGVWLPYEGAFEVLVARMNNEAFQEFFMADNDGPADSDPRNIETDQMRQAVAQTILLGWRGMLDDDDAEVPYSVEEAFNCFKKSSEFYNRVVVMSNKRANYRIKKEEVAQGNS